MLAAESARQGSFGQTVISRSATETKNQPQKTNSKNRYNMPNSIDPTKARLVRDVKNYRRKVAGNSANAAVQAEVIHHLKHKDGVKYGNLTAAQLGDIKVYSDFASFPEKPG